MVQQRGFVKELLSGHALLPALQIQFSQGSQVPLIHVEQNFFPLFLHSERHARLNVQWQMTVLGAPCCHL